jgi:arylsulfatase A-like enzyme
VPWRKDWFYEHTYTVEYPRNIPESQGVRATRWKYIRHADQQPPFEQLFDFAKDRGEMVNLVGNSDSATTLSDLRKRLDYWRSKLPKAPSFSGE